MEIRLDPFPDDMLLNDLFVRAWPGYELSTFRPVLERSLVHAAAFADERLVGFVNVATDGGKHAFLLDTCVDPDFRRRGLGAKLVTIVTEEARKRGAHWLHVDYESHLAAFYKSCGFAPSQAGLLRLAKH